MAAVVVPVIEFLQVLQRFPACLDKGLDVGQAHGAVVAPRPRRLVVRAPAAHAKYGVIIPFFAQGKFHRYAAGIANDQPQ